MVKFCCFLIQLDRRQSHNHVIQPAYRILGEADKWPHLICFYKISTYLVPNTSLLVEAKLSSPIMWNTLIAGSLENGRLGRDETQFRTPPARRLNGLSKTNRALIGDRNTRWARSKFDSYYKMFYLFNCTLWISFADEKRSSADNFIELHREFPCEDAKLEYAKLQLNSSKRQHFLVSLVITQTAFSGNLKCCFTYQERDPIPLFCNGPQKNSRLVSFSHTYARFFSIKPSYRNGHSDPQSASKASRTPHPDSTLKFIPYPAKITSVAKILKNFNQFFPSTVKALSLKLWLLAIQGRWFYFY